jgi:predicted small secreted protein
MTPMKTAPLPLIISLLILMAASLGCHTANGFGKKMENAGEKIQEKTD